MLWVFALLHKMISRDIVSYGYAALALGLMSLVHAAPAATNDPCAEIGGLTFAPPQEALACMKSFPFNETLRQNVIHTVSRVFDFFTFEDFYLDSPPPFQESTANIRAELARINTTTYEVSPDHVLLQC